MKRDVLLSASGSSLLFAHVRLSKQQADRLMFIYWAACLNEKSKQAVHTILCGTPSLFIQISVSFTYVSVRHRVSFNLRSNSGLSPIRIFALCAAKSASEPSDVSA
jgi:hypothetical protein